MKGTLFTIGYSGYMINDFISELQKYKINVLIDVRSDPFSQRYPDYNKPNLESILKRNGIYYRNYAVEFGARQEERRFYSLDGFMNFELFVQSEQFKVGERKIIDSLSQGYHIVLMCAEKDPVQCHRAIMVAPQFYRQGYEIIHLMPNGTTKTQVDVENELLNIYFPNMNQLSMLEPQKSEEEVIKDAYRKQNQKIGCRLEEEI